MNRMTLIAACAGIVSTGGDTLLAQGGVWVSTGSMITANERHTATRLNDGRVLIVAGQNGTAELYDPATGTFSPAGTPAYWHGVLATATLLTDGTVLVVGGWSGIRHAEVYDPSTDTFTPTADMLEDRVNHSATLLADGRVLIVAGTQSGTLQTQASAEIFDPVTGMCVATGSLNADRANHQAALLTDGRVLIVGGTQTTTPGSAIALDSVELYDPASGTFSVTTSMHVARYGHTATTLPDGSVLIAGHEYAEVYRPPEATFVIVGNLVHPRRYHTATTLPDGRVMLAGGALWGGPPTVTDTAEIYDPTTGIFSATGSMMTERHSHTATLLLDGRVLVAGGYDNQPLSSAELYATCPADTDANGFVDADDLINVILDWGGDGSAHGGDVDGNGGVDVDDLLSVLMAWGTCPG